MKEAKQTIAGKKQAVRDFWNKTLCGSRLGDAPKCKLGSREFFEALERHRRRFHPFLEPMVDFNASQGKKVLEIGCGLGTDSVSFAKAGADVTAIDLAPDAVKLTQEHLEFAGVRGNVMVADAENLPFRDRAFDIVYSFGVLHHTPDIEKAVKEIHRVLKPNGRVILMLYHKHSRAYYLRILLLNGILKGYLFSMSRQDVLNRSTDGPDNPISRVYTRKTARELLKGFDCEVMKATYFHYSTVNFPLFLRRIVDVFGFYLMVKARKV